MSATWLRCSEDVLELDQSPVAKAAGVGAVTEKNVHGKWVHLEEPYRQSPVAMGSLQLLVWPICVLFNDVLCELENCRTRSVVLFKVDDHSIWIGYSHPVQIFDLGRSEAIDALIRVAHDSNSSTSGGQKLHELKLNDVCILEFVNQ